MIRLSELYPIGYVQKTHGIKGELNVALDTQYNPEDFRFVIFELDAIFVPFQVESSRGGGEANRLVRLRDIDTLEESKQFVGKTVYVLLRELKAHPDFEPDSESDGLYLSDLVGYDLFDENGNGVGEIVAFNDDTLNLLLEVLLPDGRKVYVPYVDDWLVDLNQDKKTITLALPNGLIE